MFRYINQNQEMQKIREEKLKFEFDAFTNLKGETTGIIKFCDEYFTKNLDMKKLALPQNVLQNYRISCEEKKIKFQPQHKQNSWEDDKQQLYQIFSGIKMHYVQESLINQKQEDFKIKLRGIKNHDLIAYKRFHVTKGRYEEGDYLLYSKCFVSSFLLQIKNYIMEQELLYDLDSFLQSRCFEKKYWRQVIKKVVENIRLQIQKIGENLGLNISKMEANYEVKLMNQRRPEHSISLQLEGNGLNIHPFYLKIEEKVNSLHINIVEIEDPIPEDNINNLQSIFPEYKDRIYKISQNAVLILQKKLQAMDIEEVKRKLQLQAWIVDNEIFTVEEIKTLHSQFKLNSLKPYMNKKKVYWQSIEFFNRSIRIICQRVVKDRFIQECKSLLKTFIKQRQACQRYDNNFIIQIFKKYYKRGFQQKFNVTFEIGETYIIRNNNTKYSDDIREELKIVRDKIKNKLVRFICLKPLDKLKISQKIYMQKDKPAGYNHRLLGHCLYKMGNSLIKMKKVQSLNRQEEFITYVFDDRIKDSSLFHQIIKKNNINLQSFLVDAHKAKKPDRIRQYITQDCPYASKTVLLHAGPQKVTQTLRRDLTTLFTLLFQRICGIIFEHDGSFLSDVFTIVLQQIYNESLAHGNNINHSMSLNKSQFEADFYYEGGQEHLGRIEQIMKKFMYPIRKVSEFGLDLFDLEKIYAIEYHSMKVKTENKVVRFSPIIAELLDYELNRSIKTANENEKKKKFIFSINQNIQYQLVQFVISSKSGLCYKVTHDESKKRWTRRPYIQKIQEKDHELAQIVSVIKKYLNRTDYIVISAQSKSDGIHGREINYCKKFYMAKERQKKLSPITINLGQEKIHQEVQDCLEFKIEKNKLDNWYQITTYKQDLDIINSLLDE